MLTIGFIKMKIFQSDPQLRRTEYENETLRKKQQLLSEENTQIIQQNQRLLKQLELTSQQLQQAQIKVSHSNIQLFLF